MADPREDASLASDLGRLWERSRPAELERVHVLEHAVAALMAGELDEIERRRAEDEAHRLAGALGALGFPGGSSSASELERRFVRGPRRGEAAELFRLIDRVRAVVESAGR